MEKFTKTLISETTNGKVFIFACSCCVRIEFENLVWQFKNEKFKIFKMYIEKLVSGELDNLTREGNKILIGGMEKNSMFAYLHEDMLDELIELLEKSEIEIYRSCFENLYSKK